jgi:hypothetical protein
MIKLTASYKSNYPKLKIDKNTGLPVLDANGKQVVNTVFVYRVTGPEALLKQYTDAAGDNLVPDVDGTPLYFTVNPAPTDVCSMYQTLTGKNAGQFQLDLSDFRKDMAIVAAAGGNLGNAIAQSKASKYVDLPTSLSAKLQAAQAVLTTEGTEDMGEE